MPSFNQFLKNTIEQTPLDPILLDKPIEIGELPTPALTIDLEIFERNLENMQSYLGQLQSWVKKSRQNAQVSNHRKEADRTWCAGEYVPQP